MNDPAVRKAAEETSAAHPEFRRKGAGRRGIRGCA